MRSCFEWIQVEGMYSFIRSSLLLFDKKVAQQERDDFRNTLTKWQNKKMVHPSLDRWMDCLYR